VLPREVLERDRVLLQAQRVRDFVDRKLSEEEPELVLGEDTVSSSELEKLRNRLDAALKWASRDRGSTATPTAFIPRDPTLSNLQSLAANRLTIGVPLSSPPDGAAAEMLLHVAATGDLGSSHLEGVAARAGTATLTADPVTAFSVADKVDDALGLAPSSNSTGGEELRFPEPYGPEDPVWLTVGLAVAFRKLEDYEFGKLAFNAAPATGTLGERARLFIFGDWGTGTERAQDVADAIGAKLQEPESRNCDCHVIHLGDTYVAGWWWEQLLNVIRLWPVQAGVEATSWALAGNHDYYSGTDGYFGVLLGHRLFAHQRGDGEPTSVFELSNDSWVVLGLDSSWVDHDLPDAEVTWLASALSRAEQRGRRVILLSHHQPWSAFGDGPHPPLWKRAIALWRKLKAWLTGRRSSVAPLWEKVQPLLSTRPIEAWFWGHEHRLALYKPTPEIKRPRLVGNGGVPSEVTDASYYTKPDLLFFDYEAPYPIDPSWCQFAFAVVDIDGDQLSETYFDEQGNAIPV
jgi:hypothetical protein